MKDVKKLTDQELVLAARDIEAEAKLRSNRKAAATGILAVLRKHNLKVKDLADLELGPKRKTRTKKKNIAKKKRSAKVEKPASKAQDKRAKVAFKYKNPNGSEKWSGRGRAPKWVTSILTKRRMSIAQFKSDKRFEV